MFFTLLLFWFPIFVEGVEFHKVTFRGGGTFLDIVVEKSESNPQSLLLDTGSKHTYLYNHKHLALARRLRFGDLKGVAPKGYRLSGISPMSVVAADEDVLHFADCNGVKLEKWTRKQFTLGSISWFQRFAVARLSIQQRQYHNPQFTGLIGASPRSRFTIRFPTFGFVARDTDKEVPYSEFFLSSSIEPKWCVNEYVGYTPLVDKDYWLFKGGLRFGETIVVKKFKFLVDSGSGVISVPEPYFSPIKRSLESHGVVWEKNATFGSVECTKVPSLPPIHIGAETGFTISILPAFYSSQLSSGACRIYIDEKKINREWMTFGEALIRFLVTEFDKKNNRIGFCEPAKRDLVGTPLVRPAGADGGDKFSRTTTVIYKPGKGDSADYKIEEPPRIPQIAPPTSNGDDDEEEEDKIDQDELDKSVAATSTPLCIVAAVLTMLMF